MPNIGGESSLLLHKEMFQAQDTFLCNCSEVKTLYACDFLS